LITQAETDCHLKPYGHTLEPYTTWVHVSVCVCVCLFVLFCVCVVLARCQNVKLIQRPDFGVDF